MATLATLTLDVLEQIYGQTRVSRPDVDTLATAVSNASDTTWRFTLAGTEFWKRGDYAEYIKGDGTAGEIVLFLADHSVAAADVSVARAQRRTTAASSFAAGDVFARNPPYSHTEIQRAINETIDSDLQRGIWYRTNRTITYETGRNRYPLAAADVDVERVYQIDMDAATIGTATYDETGGAAEDLWTVSVAHGLAVGGAVRFSAAGGGATGYAAGIVYWVAAVPSTTTVTLSATEGGSAIAGTGDSTGTWTLQKVNVFNIREYGGNDFEVIHNVATSVESTGKAILFHSFMDTDATIHYVARSRPASGSISSLPEEIVNLIPWGVVARLTGGTAVRERYQSAADQSAISYTDSQFFKSRFEEMIDLTRKRLYRELRPQKKFIMGPVGSW